MAMPKIPFGLLYSLSIITLYIFSFFSLGISLIWTSGIPSDFWGWIGLMASSIAYLIFGLIGFVITLILAFWLAIKDKNMVLTIQKTWPLLGALLYAIFPDLMPGPVDDVFVLMIGALASIFKLKTNSPKKNTPFQQTPTHKSQAQEAEYEILDSDKNKI
jgi:uncharacterized membrane protein YkvA (DUF1232 family)